MVELVKQNLAIEPDLQNFIGFVHLAASRLNGNTFAASLAMIDIAAKLRADGAATGFPLPAVLLCTENTLMVRWGEASEAKVVHLNHAPPADAIENLATFLRHSTEAEDPSILLRRNAEMMRYLDATRERTEREMLEMQHALEKRQQELSETIRQAETDPLTGLLNRRAYDEKLDRAFRHVLRQHSEPLSLILFDLDHFKEINDEFGHQFGDAYLNKMAHAMLAVIRHEVDYAFRFGGDEFAMLLFAPKDIARKKAMDVLTSMENKVSIGIASVSPGEPCDGDLVEFIRRADNALYEAKRAGRGRIVVDTCESGGKISWQHFLPESQGEK